MLIFGGETADGVLQNSMWRLDLGMKNCYPSIERGFIGLRKTHEVLWQIKTNRQCSEPIKT